MHGVGGVPSLSLRVGVFTRNSALRIERLPWCIRSSRCIVNAPVRAPSGPDGQDGLDGALVLETLHGEILRNCGLKRLGQHPRPTVCC